MNITITNAWTQRGWSHADHLIDDGRLTELVGRTFRSLAVAAQAARKRGDQRGFVSFEYVGPDGRRYLYDDSPALPGRDVRRIREVA